MGAEKKGSTPPCRTATAEKKHRVEKRPCEVLKPYEVEREAGKVEKKNEAGPQKKNSLEVDKAARPLGVEKIRRWPHLNLCGVLL